MRPVSANGTSASHPQKRIRAKTNSIAPSTNSNEKTSTEYDVESNEAERKFNNGVTLNAWQQFYLSPHHHTHDDYNIPYAIPYKYW